LSTKVLTRASDAPLGPEYRDASDHALGLALISGASLSMNGSGPQVTIETGGRWPGPQVARIGRLDEFTVERLSAAFDVGVRQVNADSSGAAAS
jgi:hypothetical protein